MNALTLPATHMTTELVLTEIHLDFENARRKIDAETLDTLKASITEVGLLQPLVVTPREAGEFTLIAGFTRYEALRQLGHTQANCTIVKGDANTLLESHIAENTSRADLSLVSSVNAMRRLATKLGGDYAEVGKRLGFSKKAMEDRLALAKCSESVLDSLDDGKIKLGHAVILSAFTPSVQDRTLEKILAESWSVELLRERAGMARIKLTIGKFDKTDCTACQYNSDAQAQSSLFGEELPKGVCSNAQCFGEKQKVWLESEKESLVDQYGTLLDATAVDNTQIRVIQEDVIGRKEASACASCTKNCAIVDDRLNSPTIGTVRTSICNDVACFDAKVQSHIKPPKASAETVTEAPATQVVEGTQADQKEAKPEKAFDLGSAKMGNKQGEEADLMLADHVRSSFPLNREESLKVTYLAAKKLTGHLGKSDLDVVEGKLDVEVFELIREMLNNYFQTADRQTSTDANSPRGILHMIARSRTDSTREIVQSWKPSALSDYPKHHIAAICREAGFDVAYDVQKKKDGAFETLTKGSKSALLKDIEDTAFDWSEYAPAAYINRFAK